MVGGQGIGNLMVVGNIFQGIAEYLPGYQPWLGEMPAGYHPEAMAGTGFTSQQIVKTWSTGTAQFYMFQNGMIGCFKKDGRFKAWRPKRHIVISSNPRLGNLLKGAKKVNKLLLDLDKQADKVMRTSASRSKRGRRNVKIVETGAGGVQIIK